MQKCADDDEPDPPAYQPTVYFSKNMGNRVGVWTKL